MQTEIKYKQINGTFYHEETPMTIVNILENARTNKKRLKIALGDSATGRDWREEFGVAGYIGRSTGKQKIPLLVFNSRCRGGGALLDNCIVKIQESKGGKILYQHPRYHI